MFKPKEALLLSLGIMMMGLIGLTFNYTEETPRENLGIGFMSQTGEEIVTLDILSVKEKGDKNKEVDKEKKEKKDLPLEGERKISFSTDEGTWISLDVSPDGETIIFDLLGDLYTIPIAGGMAARITEGMQFDNSPRYSPDGTQIVFVSDKDGADNLWILNLETNELRQLTKRKDFLYQSPEWTPDGKYILTSISSGSSGWMKSFLWMYHIAGGSGIQFAKGVPNTWKCLGVAFGADDRYGWIACRNTSRLLDVTLPLYQLIVYDRETGKSYTQSAIYGSAFRPTLSPDGKWLVYGSRHGSDTGLRIRDLRNGNEKWLAYPVQRDDQESRATMDVLPGMSFTPDSSEIVASYGGKIFRIPINGEPAIPVPFSVDVELSLGARLDFEYPVDDSETFTVKQIRDAVPSPDGDKLALTALDRLWVMDFPDGSPSRLTDMDIGEHQPTWSPDGEWVAYATWTPEGGHIYKARIDGSESPLKLTNTPAYYRKPAWSPDGQRIVMIRSSAQYFLEEVGAPDSGGPGAEIVWVPADGGEISLISPQEGRGNPHFASDPERIFMRSWSQGLISMRWDGTDIMEHIKVTGYRVPFATQPTRAGLIEMAPKGDLALARVVNDLYVVTVPIVGGETPIISVVNPTSATFPAKKLTTIGGEFPAWSADGRKVHWSLGNTHFVYDLDAAEEAEKKEKNKSIYEPFEKQVLISAKRDIPQGIVVLRGARIVTMKGDELIENADLLIEKNRIKAVGPRGSVDIPDNVTEINLSGKTITPGFVDIHAHISPSWGIHKSQVWEYLANLAYGVTTTRDPQTTTTDVLSYSDMVTAGNLIGPRVYCTGPGIFQNEQIKNLDHARRVLKRYSKYYDTKTIKQYRSGNRQQRQWIILAAREQELMPTTEGASDLKLNLTHIIDGYPGHEHTFPIYPIYNDVIQLVAQAKTTYTPTLLVSYGGPFADNYYYATEDVVGNQKLRRFTPYYEIARKALRRGRGWFHESQHIFSRHAEFVRDLVESGGVAGIGSHGQLQGLGYHWELWSVASNGLSNRDILRMATMHGAQAIGLDKDIGSLEPGKLADLIIFSKNPLDNIRNSESISHIMINGRLYVGETLEEIWPTARKLEKGWWRGGEPEGLPGMKKK